MRILLALLALSLPAFSATVNCTGNASTDSANFSAAIAGGGVVTVNGTCSINGGTYNLSTANTTLQAGGSGAILNSTNNGGTTLQFNNNGITLQGITFNAWCWSSSAAWSNIIIKNNALQNSNCGFQSNGMHNWYVGFNTFSNLFQGGYINYTNVPGAPNPDTQASPACWADFQGWDATVITSNIFTKCFNDGFHINPNGSIHSTNSSELSYNVCTLVYRACYELQAFATNMVIKGNVALNYNNPNWNSFAYSIASVGQNLTFINNLGDLGTNFCMGGVPYYLEDFAGPALIQGNVATSRPQSNNCKAGAGGALWTFYADNLANIWNPIPTNTIQNNVMCGSTDIVLITHENNPQGNFNIVDQYNYKNTTSCPVGALATSNVSAPVFLAGPQTFPQGGNGTWNVTQLSWLPIRTMVTNVDGVFQGTQELQDVNTNFSSDLKWKYHTTLNTSQFSNGTHTIQFVATDVLGVTNSASQTFTVGNISGPSVNLQPTSVAFGSVLNGQPSSPTTVVLTNVGNATLNISSKVISGTNAADFAITSTTCGATVASNTGCNIVLTFTPSGLGSRSATLTITDNASPTTQTVPLSGTGVTTPSCSGILLNCEFINGQTNWTGSVAQFGSWQVDNTGPGGITAAHFSISSVIPSGNNVELYQDGVTLGANGTIYNLTFKANTNRTQQLNIRGVDSVVFTDYGLTYQPVITPGWQTYSTQFTVINSPASSAARITWQMDDGQPGDQIYFTDMSLTVFNPSTPEVNNISFPFIDHGSASVQFTTLTNSIGARIRYIASPGTCTAGSGGALQINQEPAVSKDFAIFPLGGLAPNTTYQVCPEVTKNGTTWSTGAGASFTTLPLPAIHPSPPIAPVNFDETYPNVTTGAFPYVTDNTTDATCAQFGTAYMNAVARWATTGTIINVPPGTVCTGGPYAFSSIPPDVHTWLPSDVNTSTGAITWNNHGLAENDLVSFGRSYATVVTYPTSTTCPVSGGAITGTGIQSGQRYQVHITDQNHIQIKCLQTQPAPVGVTELPTPLMVFTDQGSVTSGQTFYAVPWQQVNGLFQRKRIPWIIVRSGAPDAQLPPEKSQITPAWKSKMASFVDPVANISNNPACAACDFMVFGDPDANVERPVGNIRIGPGIEITTADYATSVHTSDPRYWNNVIKTYPWDGGIVFDRIWYHMLGAPNREQVGMYWTGSNMGAIDSSWTNLTYFHAAKTGLAATKTSGTVFAVALGTAFTGSTNCTLPAFTGTVSGSGSGRIFVYCNMLSSNALTVAVPAGITVTTTGATSVSAVAGSTNSTCNASDGWPKTAAGEVTVAQIACIDVSGGTIGTVTTANPGFSVFNPEGDSHMLGGIGPGPYKMLRNFSEGAGLLWHWDDGGDEKFRGSYLLAGNYFYSNPKFLHGSSTSDNLFYYIRQTLEWKGGQFINIIGNTFDTTWRELTPDGAFIALTPVVGGWISDVNIQWNTFRHGSAVMEGINGTCSGANNPCAKPGARYWFTNNLIYDIDGYTYSAFNPNGSNAPGLGWGFQALGLQDFVVDHNTYLPNKGLDPQMAAVDGNPVEGFQWTNNFNWYSGVSAQIPGSFYIANYPPNGCSGSDVTYINCWATQGIANTLYNMGKNAISGGYTDTSIPSGQATTGTMGTAFTGLTNSFIATGTVPGTVTAIKWANPSVDNILFDYRLAYNSPWKAGNSPYNAHASDVGANIDMLNVIQGYVRFESVTGITGTAATVNYAVPNSQVCRVLLSFTNDISASAPVADAGGATARRLSLSSLAPHTTYYGWVVCPGNAKNSQQPFSFHTN